MEQKKINRIQAEKLGNPEKNRLHSKSGRVRKCIRSPDQNSGKLFLRNAHIISFRGKAAIYEIAGRLPSDFGSMKITLFIITPRNIKKHRFKPDLFDPEDVEKCLEYVAACDTTVNIDEVETDIAELTLLLEKYREQHFEVEDYEKHTTADNTALTPSAEKAAMRFLKSECLLDEINLLLETTGIIGEAKLRTALFIIASTYKMPYPLHGIVQGDSGSGKSHLINAIMRCMPPEDVINVTRITGKSLYYFQGTMLLNKLFVIQDFDGLNRDSRFALRELQSAGFVSSSLTLKNSFGETASQFRKVKAHFASLSATTLTEIFYDNESRSIVLGIDESAEQTEEIIRYQNRRRSGETDVKELDYAIHLLRNCIRVLKAFEVINPWAESVSLPLNLPHKRRLNQQFQDFIAQITILHQFQRRKDKYGRLISTIDDIRNAIELFIPAIVLKADDLDSSTRQFFERLKKWMIRQKSDKDALFSEKDIRFSLHISKTKINRYFRILRNIDYIRIIKGSINKGYQYEICYWDNVEKTRSEIRRQLMAKTSSVSEKNTQ
ncbi:MAG TPA: hypothetical protein DHV29_11990 [Bacteroidales bacterium]|nr:MAG: hypothetical protein A2W94_10945 [Bacteroidetes bacterium GWE2_42_42]HBG69512.1 hypothetical protein [Bacteroidales bacterium]HCB61321.1 hypothetical protein [Bacteroidales bacterium]HCY24196.1 hypothetical protein [Bacteroidales bacterium]